ncbi:MAG: hypothetical protein AVDCRST_MAG19-4028, partial [uncultured Thermomicrobiales bacterium]
APLRRGRPAWRPSVESEPPGVAIPPCRPLPRSLLRRRLSRL